MSKYFIVEGRDDVLFYHVLAPSKEAALEVVEDLVGPLRHAKIIQLPSCPEGFTAVGDEPQILTEET
jgi:hypothetical protein